MNFVYQAYGHPDILNEALFSILSVVEQHKEQPVKFIIYTDNADYFRKHLKVTDQLHFESLTPELVKEWKGDIGFVHRVKIKMLQDYFAKYKENCLYVDTDTYFTGSVAYAFKEMEKGQLYMHTNEGVIDTSQSILTRKVKKFILKNEFTLSSGQVIKIPVEYGMWNAGALGISLGKSDLLAETLELTDIMYKLYRKHIMEQLAFSYSMQKRSEVKALDQQIFHYWNFKEFRLALHDFFDFYKDKDLHELIQLSKQILPQTLIKTKLDYMQLPSWRRKIKKWRGKEWKMPDYTFVR